MGSSIVQPLAIDVQNTEMAQLRERRTDWPLDYLTEVLVRPSKKGGHKCNWPKNIALEGWDSSKPLMALEMFLIMYGHGFEEPGFIFP